MKYHVRVLRNGGKYQNAVVETNIVGLGYETSLETTITSNGAEIYGMVISELDYCRAPYIIRAKMGDEWIELSSTVSMWEWYTFKVEQKFLVKGEDRLIGHITVDGDDIPVEIMPVRHEFEEQKAHVGGVTHIVRFNNDGEVSFTPFYRDSRWLTL